MINREESRSNNFSDRDQSLRDVWRLGNNYMFGKTLISVFLITNIAESKFKGFPFVSISPV